MSTPEYLVVALVAAIAVVAVARFEVFLIKDMNSTPEPALRYLSRPGWIAVCLISIPVGGIVYLYYGKRR